MRKSIKAPVLPPSSYYKMEIFALLLLCVQFVSSTNEQECSLDACHVLNTFKEELRAIKRQIMGRDEDTDFKNLERRLRSLEQTSRCFYHDLLIKERSIMFY